jgi:hypothetical protein
VTAKSKRRWYQFSLGTLFVTVTVLCVLLGRIDYLRRRAYFHVAEARWHAERIQAEKGLSENDAWGYAEMASSKGNNTAWFGPPNNRFQLALVDNADARAVRHHYRLSEEFAFAASHPWVIVNEAERRDK